MMSIVVEEQQAVNLPKDEGGPVFDRPWQAQAFALTVELYKSGNFTWPEWVEVFSKEIKSAPQLSGETTNDAYYRQWIAALERMVASRQLVTDMEVGDRADEWRRAHLNTPHGQPIVLTNAACPPPVNKEHHHHHKHDHHEHGDDDHHHRPTPVAVSPPRHKISA